MTKQQIRRADDITAQAHADDARTVCGLHSHKLSLVVKVGGGYGISQSVEKYLNTLIYNFNKHES